MRRLGADKQKGDLSCRGAAGRARRPAGHPSLAAAFLFVVLVANRPALADEGGLSFWLPGFLGSFAATPATPGLTVASFLYASTVRSGEAREFPRGGQIDVGFKGSGVLLGLAPNYVFSTPVLGAQASVSLTALGGRSSASIDGTLTGPRGAMISGSRTDSVIGIGDLIPQAALKWNFGLHNVMVYATGDIPVGDYDKSRLANIGLGHGALDGGGGYTFFNAATGLEFSAVAGLTYNLVNPSTHYQNGLDAHLDLGASAFLNKQLNVGVAGYLYQQITGDSGSGARLGPFRSRVAGVGPQLTYLFPAAAGIQATANLKAFREFAADNRPEGWTLWFTLAFAPASGK